MKKHLLIFTLSIFIVSCSGSKQTTTKNTSAIVVTETTKNKKDIASSVPKEIHHKVNTIIQNYLEVPISSIARSDIKTTDNGYEWKFMNVKTGENFIANSDFNFKSIEIVKNKRS